jgi:hypothetical protein
MSDRGFAIFECCVERPRTRTAGFGISSRCRGRIGKITVSRERAMMHQCMANDRF